jgi:hypothetical protein
VNSAISGADHNNYKLNPNFISQKLAVLPPDWKKLGNLSKGIGVCPA